MVFDKSIHFEAGQALKCRNEAGRDNQINFKVKFFLDFRNKLANNQGADTNTVNLCNELHVFANYLKPKMARLKILQFIFKNYFKMLISNLVIVL